MNESKDTQKREGISVGLRVGLAVTLAFIVSIIVFLLYKFNVNLYVNPYYLLFLIIPSIIYFLGIFINLGIQNSACGKIDIVKIATSNLFNFVIPLVTLILITFIPFFRSVIDTVIPYSFDYTLRTSLITMFWVFWSVTYSQVFTSGFLTVC